MQLSRRDLLAALAGASVVPFVGFDAGYARALARPVAAPPLTRLWLRREGTGEEVSAVVRTAEGYAHSDLTMLSWLLRDVQAGNAAVWIDPRLFELMAAIQGAMSAVHGAPVPFVVTSGYRTSRHNAGLEGAARASLHRLGHAGDIKAVGYSPEAVAVAGAMYARGGVGIYPSFCHLDIGRVRAWSREKRPGTVPGPPLAQPGRTL